MDRQLERYMDRWTERDGGMDAWMKERKKVIYGVGKDGWMEDI